MSTIEVEVWSLADTAYALRRALGDARNWRDFLTDALRGRADYHGLRLLPVARVRPDRDRCRRPVYSQSDVLDFIREARLRAPPEHDPKRIRGLVICLDSDAMALPWALRRPIPGPLP